MSVSRFAVFIVILCFPAILLAQEDSLSRKEIRMQKKQLKVEQGKLLITPLAGPAYTPEMGFTLAASIMLSYKTNPRDSLIQRSSSPVSFGASSTGAIFFSSIISTFWFQDKLRIYGDIWYKDMPDHYWGAGYENAVSIPKSDTTTAYNRRWWWFNPRILCQFRPDFFLGLNIDYNNTVVTGASEGVLIDPDYIAFGPENLNSGLGIILRYDSRDIPVNAYSGLYIDLRSTFYTRLFGGDNNYEIYLVDFRKYFPLERKGRTFAMQVKGRFGVGEVPYGEMSQLGTPFDLRGYTWGQFRDKSMLFFLGEYRHMFLKASGELSKHGMVGWLGTGTIGPDPGKFDKWIPNFGFGYRFEVQPRMNLRIDIGIGKETSGFYFNFNEAF
jgi:hypothetical protein